MINHIVLMGRLVADPELKTTTSGLSVTNFRIAVDRNYGKNGDEKKSDFIDIVCWRNTAEFVCRYFGKGSLIALEGQLQTRTYQAKDGSNRTVYEVVADNVSFTGERRDNGNHQQAAYPQQQQAAYPQQQAAYPQQQAAYPQQQQAAYPQQQAAIQGPGLTNDSNSLSDDDLPF